jgi:hypothetical protein
MSAAVITASASVLVAVLAFLLNQVAQVRQERRQARLSRVNSQLRDLYGPLHALVDVNERLWESLRESKLPGQADRRPGGGTEEWHRWRDHALMPTNRKIRDLIFANADLLIEEEFPQPLQDFCAHVAALEVQLAAEAGTARERPLVRHPGDVFVKYVRDTFQVLKAEQRKLLWRSATGPPRLSP